MKVVPAVRASPKSRIFSVQSLFTTMFDGFKSYEWIQVEEVSVDSNDDEHCLYYLLHLPKILILVFPLPTPFSNMDGKVKWNRLRRSFNTD